MLLSETKAAGLLVLVTQCVTGSTPPLHYSLQLPYHLVQLWHFSMQSFLMRVRFDEMKRICSSVCMPTQKIWKWRHLIMCFSPCTLMPETLLFLKWLLHCFARNHNDEISVTLAKLMIANMLFYNFRNGHHRTIWIVCLTSLMKLIWHQRASLTRPAAFEWHKRFSTSPSRSHADTLVKQSPLPHTTIPSHPLRGVMEKADERRDTGVIEYRRTPAQCARLCLVQANTLLCLRFARGRPMHQIILGAFSDSS